jgi:hypothetical protein
MSVVTLETVGRMMVPSLIQAPAVAEGNRELGIFRIRLDGRGGRMRKNDPRRSYVHANRFGALMVKAR